MVSILWNFKILGRVMRWDGNLGDKVTPFPSQVIVDISLSYNIFPYNPLKKSANQWVGQVSKLQCKWYYNEGKIIWGFGPFCHEYVGKCPGELVFLCSKNLSAASRTPSHWNTKAGVPLVTSHSSLLCEMFKVPRLGSWPPVKKTAKAEALLSQKLVKV